MILPETMLTNTKKFLRRLVAPTHLAVSGGDAMFERSEVGVYY